MATKQTLRKLGASDLHVTSIGLGCWQFSKRKNIPGKFWPDLDDSVMEQIVQVSLDLGINWFDTAEVYGNGASEQTLSAALQKAGIGPGEVIIATKWWPMFRFASNIPRSIDSRLRALDPYPIDLYQVHQPYGFSTVAEEMTRMAELAMEKKIRYIGVSNFSEKQMREAARVLEGLGMSLVSNQVRYNLIDRTIEQKGILAAAKELGITIIAYSPLAQGILTGKFHDRPELLKHVGWRKNSAPFKPEHMLRTKPLIENLKELASKYRVTPAQIALNWVIHANGEVVVAIPGATSVSQARDNTGAMAFRLTSSEIEQLSRITQ